jgi:H+/Cl- antiporter ClcA
MFTRHDANCTLTASFTLPIRRYLQVQYGYINLEEIFLDSTRLSVVDLSSLLLAKIAATSVCVGGGLVGGLFAPSLFIGALVGDIMGHFVANT